MTDLIPRDAKHEEAFMDAVWSALKADTSDLGKQQRILAAFRAIHTIYPAAIRDAALREAAAVVASCTWSEYWIYDGDYVEPLHLSDCIIALIGEKK